MAYPWRRPARSDSSVLPHQVLGARNLRLFFFYKNDVSPLEFAPDNPRIQQYYKMKGKKIAKHKIKFKTKPDTPRIQLSTVK